MSLSDKPLINNSIGRSFIPERLYKILVIGDFGVGKTSIIKQYTEGTFNRNYKVTIGADFSLKEIIHNNKLKINLQLWDIAGHERFGYSTSVFYRYSVAAVIVFDLTRPLTFNSIEKWLEDLRRKVRQKNGENIPVILLANKGDITTDTLPPKINIFCKENDIFKWFITSARDNVNINEAFQFVLDKVMEPNDTISNDNESVDSFQLQRSVDDTFTKKCCRSQ